MIRMTDYTTKLPPPAREERQRVIELLERIRLRRERMLTERGGRYFPPAADVMREVREANDEQSP